MSEGRPLTPDIMVDLETLGSRPGSVIVSIGAVAFNGDTGEIGEEFYRVIDVASCEASGLTIDGDTVLWWMRQGDAARAAITDAKTTRLGFALIDFTEFYLRVGGRRIWGHGGNFDEPLLAAAYRAAGSARQPWKFWDSRCTRTIFEIAGVKPDRAAGVHHNALDDALAQARAVIEAKRRIAERRAPDPEHGNPVARLFGAFSAAYGGRFFSRGRPS